ncbi:MAG TPA: FkbM family methyltransferase [Herbaspirillum sp.]|jgi:FkbM family methyltransferase|nr:FkbM family methyltransferase [Herbaspirillum sp.]
MSDLAPPAPASAATPMPLNTKIFRIIVRMLPDRAQRAISKLYFFRQIRAGDFKSAEIEWERLADWLKPGDWCIDVGANVGRYTLKMSALVGPSGHVIAFEPLTRVFDLLTHFVEKGQYRNVTLLNAAAAEQSDLIDISPDFAPLNTAYIFDTNTRTSILKPANQMRESKMGLRIDALGLPHRIALIKVDVEGFELAVCKGMSELIRRDHPVLIVEDHDTNTGVTEFLQQFGYETRRLSADGRNLVCTRKDN